MSVFNLTLTLELNVPVEVEANSLEEALKKAAVPQDLNLNEFAGKENWRVSYVENDRNEHWWDLDAPLAGEK